MTVLKVLAVVVVMAVSVVAGTLGFGLFFDFGPEGPK